MTIAFISDLHISEAQSEIGEQFVDFLANRASKYKALYILGDLFEYWLGDDDINPYLNNIKNALLNYTKTGIPIYFIHGNRDFLIGERFSNETGIKILPDPTVIKINNEDILISHGDLFCTDDIVYQETRKLTRDPKWQNLMLRKSLEERKTFAFKAREKSKEYMKDLADDITDVNQSEIANTFKEFNLKTIIHGHTHRPATHNTRINNIDYKRIVLGDWYDQGSCLEWNDSGPNLIKLYR
jgi:UDP-2,3-diacylglucosamine hydrolase